MSNSQIIYPFENGTDSYDEICKDLIVGVIRGFAGLVSVLLVFQHLHQVNNPVQPDNLVEMQTVFGFYCLYAQWDDEQSKIPKEWYSKWTSQNVWIDSLNGSAQLQESTENTDDIECTDDAKTPRHKTGFQNGNKSNTSNDCYAFHNSQKSLTDCWGF